MNEDIIREITFPTYPKDVLLNAFHHKEEDAVYISVKKKWAALLASPNFCGCSFSANREKDVPRIHFMTLTPSTRYSESWQLTHYDGEGPYGHGSYSDTNREAGHTMRELVCELAGYSADREITARAHFLSQEGNNAACEGIGKKGCHIRMYGKPRMRIPGSFRPNLRRNDHD